MFVVIKIWRSLAKAKRTYTRNEALKIGREWVFEDQGQMDREEEQEVEDSFFYSNSYISNKATYYIVEVE